MRDRANEALASEENFARDVEFLTGFIILSYNQIITKNEVITKSNSQCTSFGPRGTNQSQL